ncbi:15236_t:CDS:1 [Gigaspora rosea]|nr:15236_t:CDS:1 [Gigaspora rosea]
MYIRYNNWSSAYVKPTYITASAQLLPEVDKWLAEFLSPLVLSLQRSEIAEAFWYGALLVSKESINISLSQEKSEIDFYKNLDDFPATNVNEIISSLSTLSIQEIWEITRYRASHKNYVIILNNGNHICTYLRRVNRGLICRYFAKVMTVSQIAAFHILMISRHWYSDEHYAISDETLISQLSITYQNGSATSILTFISDLTLMYPGSGISFNISKTLNNRRAYRVMNGRCKKAMAVGLDAGSAAMESLNKFLETFIWQYFMDSNQNLDINTSSGEIQDNESCESSDLDDNQENVILFDVSTVKDPMVKKRKGAPKAKRIKSSFETKNTQSNTKKEKATRFCSRYK